MTMDEIFVGRDAEMAQLEQFLGQVLKGTGQVVFVTGEAGAGKTALVREFARRSQTQHGDLVVALGEADAVTGIGDPYLPFREVLRLLTGDVEAQLAEGAISYENASRLRDFVGVSARVLLDLGPDLLEFFVPGVALVARVGSFLAGQSGLISRLKNQVETAQAGPLNGSSGIEQEHIFEQYTNVLKTLASHRPIMLILDDLQWADAASISLLFRLGRRIGDSRIMIIGTYRPDDVALGRPSAGLTTGPSAGLTTGPSAELTTGPSAGLTTGPAAGLTTGPAAELRTGPAAELRTGPAAELRTGPMAAAGQPAERHPLLAVVNELKRYGGIEVQLSDSVGQARNGSHQISQQAVEFVSAYIDAAYAPHNLDEHIIRLIAERTSGHPLFTVELLRSLEERGWLTRMPADGSNNDGVWTCEYALELDALPPRVEAVVTERIDRLTDEERRVLTVASVEGNEFTAQVIAEIENLNDLQLVRLLEEELQGRHRLIQEIGVKRVNGQMLFLYQFHNHLFQRYLHDRLGMAQRLMLHNAVGEALERLYASYSHHMEVTLAHHFLAGGNDEKALHYLVVAGDHAWSHHATHEALAHYDKALEVASRLGDAVDPEMIQELHTRRAQVQGWLGHVDDAIPDYERALEIARERDDVEGQVVCLNRMGALLAGPRGFNEGIRHAQQALEIARKGGDKPGIIDSLNCLGNFQANLGALAEAAASHEEALALARELNDERRIADSLDGLRLAGHDGRTGDTALLEEVIKIRRRLGDKKGLLDPLAALGNSLARFAGRLDHAEQLLSEALEISQRIGERTTRPWILAMLAEVFWRRGRLGGAYIRANEALDLAREIEHEEWIAMSHTTLSMVNVVLYRYAQAAQHAAQGHDLAAKSGGFWVELLSGFQQGVVALQAGDVDAAVAFFESAMAQVKAANLGIFASLGVPWLATAYAAQGQINCARELIDRCLADPALENMLELRLMTQYAHGRILAAADPAGAEAALNEALALAEQVGNLFFQIEVHGALGRLYRAQGRADHAASHFTQVLKVGQQVSGSIVEPETRDAYLLAAPFAEARASLRDTTLTDC